MPGEVLLSSGYREAPTELFVVSLTSVVHLVRELERETGGTACSTCIGTNETIGRSYSPKRAQTSIALRASSALPHVVHLAVPFSDRTHWEEPHKLTTCYTPLGKMKTEPPTVRLAAALSYICILIHSLSRIVSR